MAEFDKIGVVGVGMMGSEIALMFALSGYPTLLSDLSPDAAKRASPSVIVSKLTRTAVSSSRLYSRTRT
jgi:3-hydroxyacyl-CoA dehydrogenase